MNAKIRALVVDDSAFMRCAIGRILGAMTRAEVVGYAKNGAEAIEQARQLKPDLITLDIEMPEVDGLKALPRLKYACSAKILMISSLTKAGSSATLTALRLGAADFVSKDQSQISENLSGIESQLRAKVTALFLDHPVRSAAAAGPVASGPPTTPIDLRKARAVVIGSSTGGPPVLEQIVAALPAEYPLPLVIAQHMPEMFTRAMSERLNEMARVNVLHVEQALPLQPGHVYVAVGGRHVRLAKRRDGGLWAEACDEPHNAPYKPSVNELFRSAAACCGPACLAAVLTGMGDDGLEGAKDLHAAGAPIVAQDANSCIVYGMPRAVTDARLIRGSLTPPALIKLINSAAPAFA